MTPPILPGKKAADYAWTKVFTAGTSYVYGAAGPLQFDCSGLMMRAWSQAGVTLPHNAAAQRAACADLKTNGLHLEPGDLVFYYTPITHVAMFIGYRADGVAMVAQATDEDLGLQVIPMTGYLTPVAYGRPKYQGWKHNSAV